jgi:hypothetical protein
MNLEGLDKFIQAYNDADTPTALGNTLAICSLRHSGHGKYAAFIYDQDHTSYGQSTFPSMVEDDDFWQGHIKACPWFPLRFGNSPQEALDKLVKFLLLETPLEHRELLKWDSTCASLAFKLVESPESNRSDLNIERYKAESYTRNS